MTGDESISDRFIFQVENYQTQSYRSFTSAVYRSSQVKPKENLLMIISDLLRPESRNVFIRHSFLLNSVERL